MLYSTITLSLLSLLPAVLARTNLVGCTSSVSGPSLVWYVPETGELCDFLDCGGGRAPPKTTVPGCAAYEGTETYKPSFIPGYGQGAKSTAVSVASSVAATTSAEKQETSSAKATATAVSSSGVSSSAAVVSSATLSTITTPAQLPSSSGSVRIPLGTGSLTGSAVGGNNLTATATLSTGAPANTGAAGMVGVNSFLGLVMGAVGLAVL